MNQYEAVLYDFDGTIVDTEWIIYEEVLAIFKREGQDLPLEQYAKCIGSSYETWSPQTYLEELTGKTYDWEQIREVRNQKIRARLENEDPTAGAIESIRLCKEKGYRLGVVSSSSHDWVDMWLEKLNLTAYFETVTCRGDAPKIKPAPDLYVKAAELLQLSAQRCLVIEDSRNGMLAAREAGMDVITVPNRVTSVSDFSEAKAVIHSLTELHNHL